MDVDGRNVESLSLTVREAKGVPMPDQSIQAVVHRENLIERFQREIDQMAIVQVAAYSLDRRRKEEVSGA